jgi:hypothetical protein
MALEKYIVDDNFGLYRIRYSPLEPGYSWHLIFKDGLLYAILYHFEPT